MAHTLNHVTIAAPERQPGTAVQMAATGILNITNSIIANHATGLARSDGTLTEDYNLFHDNETDRHGLNATHVWRHNVTAFSDWAVGQAEGGLMQLVYLPLVVRP